MRAVGAHRHASVAVSGLPRRDWAKNLPRSLIFHLDQLRSGSCILAGPQRTRRVSWADPVSFESSSDVAILRIDDGKVNAISPAVLDGLGAALDKAREARQAVVLAGHPGRFSAGFDLRVLGGGDRDAALSLVRGGAQMALRLARHPAPVVAACTGHTLAMGAVLLMAADTRIGARGEFKIGFNEVAIGITTPIFVLELARDRLSKRHFVRATVQAEIYTPDAAVDAGFLDRVTSADRVVRGGRRRGQTTGQATAGRLRAHPCAGPRRHARSHRGHSRRESSGHVSR